MSDLTSQQRNALPDSDFAVPHKRALPMHDAKHARLAWDMVDRTGDLSPSERDAARTRIKRRAGELGIDTKEWQAAAISHNFESVDGVFRCVSMQAMALDMPHTPDHPNKAPFSGVMTKIDQPSDNAPEGSNGKRVVLTRAAAEEALHTLLGMPIDYTENFDGHDVKKKIGVITGADIRGHDLHIEGFFYAADFPEEVRRIKAMKHILGFSWEIRNIYTPNVNQNPMFITGCTFTGAAVLRKDKAAYTSTSLAAASTKELNMNPEELKALLAESLKANNAALETSIMASVDKKLEGVTKALEPMQAAAHHLAKVEPHAKALETAAMGMERDGLGGHALRGHVRACMAMATHLRAQAGVGKLADEWPGWSGDHAGTGNPSMHAGAADIDAAVKKVKDEAAVSQKALQDQIASLSTQMADMKAAAQTSKEGGTNTDRKTLTPAITTLLAKAGITAPSDDKKLAIGELDVALSKAGLSMQQRLEVKTALDRAGSLSH